MRPVKLLWKEFSAFNSNKKQNQNEFKGFFEFDLDPFNKKSEKTRVSVDHQTDFMFNIFGSTPPSENKENSNYIDSFSSQNHENHEKVFKKPFEDFDTNVDDTDTLFGIGVKVKIKMHSFYFM